MAWIVSLFAARWLGHGRAVESYLSAVGAIYGLALIEPGAAFDSKATFDIAWWGYGYWLSTILIAYGVASGVGLIGNIKGWQCSKAIRFSAACSGFMIWSWFSFKFAVLGNFAAVGFPFTFCAALYSIRIMGLSLAGLPRPGAPGAM